MKILHITNTIKGASGVVTFVREISDRLHSYGINSKIMTLNEKNLLFEEKWDLVHIHGLWIYHKIAQLAQTKYIPIIYSTHGMTAPWSMHHKWWKKLPAWWLYQKRDLTSAAVIHCTTDQELEWNKKHGFNNCIVVPLGTKEKQYQPLNTNKDNDKVLLFVGRIYPVKGLVNLIKAWNELFSTKSLLKPNVSKWKLRIVGPDEAGHMANLLKLVNQYKLNDSIEFAGPKFGVELSEEYEKCDCLVLPSFTENFGATVIDALAHGKPCITSTFTPWKEIKDRKCGWWVSNRPSELAKTIQEMMEASDDLRQEMGKRGIALVQDKYTWEAVTSRMIEAYQSVINNS